MSYYNYENGLNDRIKYGAIVGTAIALIFYAISLITNTSPTSPKEDTKNGIDIYAIMKQNGHTSIDTTMKYLKTLGLIIDTEFTNKFDKITI